MLPELVAEFAQRFGRPPELAARAPGRVNLLGEHTDYNEGWVLPCAIDRDTVVLAARRDDARVRIHSRERGETLELDPRRLARRGDWARLRAGRRASRCASGATTCGGLDLAVASDVPPESGLSSSAALCVALVTALDAAQGLGLDAVARARVAHRAENGFVGVACGIMDPFASALARRDHALRLDCRSAEASLVPLPSARLGLADRPLRCHAPARGRRLRRSRRGVPRRLRGRERGGARAAGGARVARSRRRRSAGRSSAGSTRCASGARAT